MWPSALARGHDGGLAHEGLAAARGGRYHHAVARTSAAVASFWKPSKGKSYTAAMASTVTFSPVSLGNRLRKASSDGSRRSPQLIADVETSSSKEPSGGTRSAPISSATAPYERVERPRGETRPATPRVDEPSRLTPPAPVGVFGTPDVSTASRRGYGRRCGRRHRSARSPLLLHALAT